MGEKVDFRGPFVDKLTADWPVEKRIGARAAILFREEHPEFSKVLGRVWMNLAAAMVVAFETAAIELRDEIEMCVITDLAGLDAEEACRLMNERLTNGVSPITQRLKELSEEVEAKNVGKAPKASHE